MPKPSHALRFALLLACLAVSLPTLLADDYKDFKARRTNADSFDDSVIFRSLENATTHVETPYVIAINADGSAIATPTGSATAANQTAVQGTAGAAAPTKGQEIVGKDASGNSQLYGIGANKAFPLGTSVTLGDGLANTAVLPDAIGGVNNSGPLPVYPYVFNGLTWDRSPGDATNGLKVQVAGVSTAANQATANSSLSTIASNTTAAGAPILAAGENHVGEVGGRNALVSGNFTRPADTTAYASGDLVANSTTVVSVTAIPLTIGRGSSGVSTTGMIRRARLRKSGNSTTNASFRIHLWRTNPFTTSTVTMTIAAPGVVTWTAHGLSTGAPIQFTNSGGALPTGVTASTTYYVIAVDANTFTLASSAANAYAGTTITTSGSQSGVHTAFAGNGTGDNGVITVGGNTNYVGKIDVTMDQSWSDGASGNGVPVVGSEINFTSQNYYALIEARGAYTPISAEVFTLELEVLQN